MRVPESGGLPATWFAELLPGDDGLSGFTGLVADLIVAFGGAC